MQDGGTQGSGVQDGGLRPTGDDPLGRLREEAAPSPMVDIWLTEDGVRRIERRVGPEHDPRPDDGDRTTDGG